MLQNCYQRSTFTAPQAAICQPTNLQPQFKSDFKSATPSLAATRASPFSRPSAVSLPSEEQPGGGAALSGNDGGVLSSQDPRKRPTTAKSRSRQSVLASLLPMPED